MTAFEIFQQFLQPLITPLTIIFLAYQIYILRKNIGISQYQAAMQMLFDWRSDIMQDPTLADRYKDSEYFSKVFEEQGIESYFHTMKIFHILEFFYFVEVHGVHNKYMWGEWETQVKIIMTPEKNRTLWHRAKAIGLYNKYFIRDVDALIEKIEKKMPNQATT